MNDEMARYLGEGLRSEDAKHDRVLLVNRIIFGLCALFLLLLAVTWPTRADAGTLTYENPYTIIRFLDTPCDLDVPAKAALKAAVGMFTVVAVTPFGSFPVGQEEHRGCWLRDEHGYKTVWDDGESIEFKADDVRDVGV